MSPRTLRAPLWAVLAVALGCGEFPTLPPCTTAEDCNPEQACVEGRCVSDGRGDARADARAPGDARVSSADVSPLPDGEPTPVDAAPPSPDAASMPADAAPADAASDAAAPADAAAPKPDAHAVPPDAALPTPDAALPPPDAALPTPDTALPTPDAALLPPDAAPPTPDAFVNPADAFVNPPDAAPDLGPPCEIHPEVCNGVDDDCDDLIDEIDPVEYPLPCVPAETQCGATRWACLDTEAPVCLGAHAVGDREACNGEDDDCDGVVDNGFDLSSDPDNCGACGIDCDPLPHGRGLCVVGECLVSRCEDTWRDVDAIAENGCERAVVGAVLYVRTHGDDAAAGTVGAPLATLAEANSRAARAADPLITTIDLGSGHFAGNLDLDAWYVTVRGAGRNLTYIDGSLELSGRHTRVQDLTVDAGTGPVGIHLTCAEGCAVVSTRIVNVGPTPDPTEPGGPIAGLRITSGQNHLVAGNEILEVSGHTPPAPALNAERGCQWEHGSAAMGILLEAGANASRLLENRIYTITGGAGTTPTRDSCNGGSLGGLGGPAYGILLSDRSGHYTLVANDISGIEGGRGGDGQPGIPLPPGPDPSDADLLRSADGNGGGGGLAAGIRIEGAGHRLRDNILRDIRGGDGGDAPAGPEGLATGEPGPDAQGFGLYFHPFVADDTPPPVDLFAQLSPDESALDNDIDPSNTHDGDPILFCRRQTVEWTGYHLSGARTPTNLGRMVLVDCDGARVHDNVIEGFVGATGRPSDDDADAVPGAEGAGIFLLGTDDAVIAANRISGIRGGQGAQGSYDASFVGLLTAGGRGGHAAAIRLRASHRNLVTDNDLGGTTGGPGGPGGLAHGNGGPGGHAAGIEFVGGSAGNVLQRNTIRGLSGGPGGPTDPFPLPPAWAPTGRAYGVSFADPESRDNRLDETNTYEGLPFTYLHTQPNSVVADRVYRTCKAMTNLGQVVILDSPQTTVTGVEIVCEPAPGEVSDLVGEPGLPATSQNVGVSGGAYVAVRVESSDFTTIDGLRVDGVQGGPGGPPHILVRGGDGGLGCALSVQDSEGFRLNDAWLSNIRAGTVAPPQPPLPGTPQIRPGGLAADAIAIDLARSPGAELDHLLLHDVTSEGHALGIFYTDAGTGNVVRQATLVGIRGDNLGHGSFDNQFPDYTAGILVQGGGVPGHVLLDNLVVADVSHNPAWALFGHQIDRTNVCFRGDRQNFLTGAGLPFGTIRENPEPLFRVDSDPPYGLDPASVCVDLAEGECVEEPAPPGGLCLTDLGYEGNSPRGQIRIP